MVRDDDNKLRRENVLVRHALTGTALLRRGDPVDLPKAFETAMDQFRDVARNTDGFTTARLKAAITRFRFTLEKLRVLNQMADAVYHFFGGRNLAGIQRWATLMAEGHDRHLKSSIRAGDNVIRNLRTGAVVGPPCNIPGTTDVIFSALSTAA